MMRLLGSVLGGYVAMFATVILLLTGAYLAMGPDRAFELGTYDVTRSWIVVYLVVSIGAALLGGVVVSLLSSDRRAPMVLAGLVFALGMASAASARDSGDGVLDMPRSADTPNLTAMLQARSPTWTLMLNPVLGALGVLVGARRRGRS